MKKFILAIMASSLIATPVLAAPNQSQHSQSQHSQPRQAQASHGQSQKAKVPAKAPVKTSAKTPTKAHQWKQGERFDRSKATSYRVISNPCAHKLQTAPNGYRWVQSGTDALLVRLSNNLISSVVTGAIR